MSNENRAAKRNDRARKEDVVLNRILVWFGCAVVAEFVLLWLGRYYNAHSTSSDIIMLAYNLHQFLNVFVWVALGLGVVSAVWLAVAKKSGKRCGIPKALTIAFLLMFVMILVINQFQDEGIQFLCRAVLGVTVMALIFYLYQREFFVSAVVTAAGILGLWLIRRYAGIHDVYLYVYMALAAVLLLLVVLGGRMMQKNGGELSVGGKTYQVFPKNAGYGMTYLTCGITAAALIVSLVAGTAVAYYLIFALVAWLFVMAVYYTVKLM